MMLHHLAWDNITLYSYSQWEWKWGDKSLFRLREERLVRSSSGVPSNRDLILRAGFFSVNCWRGGVVFTRVSVRGEVRPGGWETDNILHQSGHSAPTTTQISFTWPGICSRIKNGSVWSVSSGGEDKWLLWDRTSQTVKITLWGRWWAVCWWGWWDSGPVVT